LTPKLRLERSFAWEHHREGWGRVEALVRRHLACPDGVLFVSAVEDQLFYRGPILEPWVGVVHQVPHHDLPGFPDVERLLQLKAWRASEPHCLGLWTLTDYVRRFLRDRGIRVPVGVLPYPTSRDVPSFDWERFTARDRPRLLHVGEFLRDYQAFFDLEVPGWQKQMLEPTDWSIRARGIRANDSVQVIPAVGNEAYDQLLTESVVFLHLRDAPANTVIVECIARATPVCVNRVGGVAEYLGSGYPLYHDGDAPRLLREPGRIRDAHAYLLEHRERVATDEEFLEKARSSAVYVSLPTPPSRQGAFRRFDVTVLVAVYARLRNLREQLDRFARQEDAPDFEVVLWNNDPRNAPHVDQLVRERSADLAIRVIHSSDNIYCAMRLAVPAIARSDVLLVCDDDVFPSPRYVRTLYDAHQRLGPDAAVCLRGHVFHPHRLDPDDPDRVWRREEHMTFHDQAAEECVVDFAHADNLVITMDLLRRASLHAMTHAEYVLVDDYWLSYVLSARLGATCRKVQAPDLFRFTDCADDPDVALYHNPRVHEQRVRLYVEHMRAGWPRGAQLT
jgi:Glycosyl transferase family 2